MRYQVTGGFQFHVDGAWTAPQAPTCVSVYGAPIPTRTPILEASRIRPFFLLSLFLIWILLSLHFVVRNCEVLHMVTGV